MRLIVLGSSSAANGYVLDNGREALAIECWCPLADLQRAVGFDLRRVAGVLLTHEHGDHARHALKYIKADLPQGAKYFAIRHITGKDNVCIFMLDDVTFVKGYAKPKGYNVYRDGKLVATLNEQTMTIDDKAETEGLHRYAITAVYDKGESKPVWIDVTTAIQLI